MNKSKSMALIIPGLLLQFGCTTARRILAAKAGEPQLITMSLMIGALVGLLLLIIGLRHYAKSKGYSDAHGLLGLLSLLGVLITAILPDKTKV